MTNLEKLNEDFKKAKAEFIALARDAFNAELQAVFVKVPELHFITWTQYAPYFNDGEPCEFSYNGMEFSMIDAAEEGEFEDSDGDWDVHYSKPRADTPEAVVRALEILKPLDKFLRDNEDYAREAFGQDSRVIVKKTGIQVEDYSGNHD